MAGAKPAGRPPGWWYPWIFVGGMLIVIAVNAVLVIFAVGTFSGLETTDHYRKGLAYQDALDATARQAERGWSVQIDFQPRPAGGDGSGASDGQSRGELALVFADRDGAPLERLEVEAQLVRPTQSGFDQTVVLDGEGGGRYRTSILFPMPGQWDLRILARKDDSRFQSTHRLFVP
ncbi:MAG: FixH family protein [Defluviicoccus sp.]